MLAYLIHTKEFKDNSLLVDFFTRDHGIIRAVANGARSHSKNNLRGLLRPFTKIFIHLRGSSDLKTLNSIELAEQPLRYNRQYLAVVFYINELLYILCGKNTGLVFDDLFDKYDRLLSAIKKSQQINHADDMQCNLEIYLREFELDLLNAIGYGLQFDHIKPDFDYAYDFTAGFYIADKNKFNTNTIILNGNILLNIQARNWAKEETVLAAKKLLRSVIQYYIGKKELHSRKLLIIE